jgi:hypothetical protein
MGLVLALLVQAPGGDIPKIGQGDEALTRRFTPASVPRGTYVVFHSDQPIEVVVAELRARDPSPAPGAWKVQREEPLEAFDGASRADRFRIAELYVGVHPFVARGSLVRSGRREAFTLISPHPDASLTRLETGTIVIVFHVPF